MIILKENQTIKNGKIVIIADKSIKKISTKAKKKVKKYFKQIKNI